jgi:membrane-bound lytic murein transglycosylase D
MDFLLKYFLVFILSFSFSLTHANESIFPKEELKRSRIEFWKRVYSEVTTQEGFLHDDTDLSLIYKKITVPNERSKAAIRQIKEEKEAIRSVFQDIIEGRPVDESVHPWVINFRDKSPEQLQVYREQVRWQRGLSERFLEGVQRSNIYLEEIKKVFIEEGVPTELAFLPHVESSFQYQAYSKVGAAGIWQFMRATARLYKLQINYVYDDRLDPLICARAAAKLLKYNYERLQSWPLALTAYNHGVYGIERAVRETGSSRLQDIIDVYRGRRFGFASQNFYASFVAAYELAQEPEKHFGKFSYFDPISYFEIKLPREISISGLMKVLNMDEDEFKFYNRSIRPNAFRLNLALPRNFPLKLPKGMAEREPILMAELQKAKSAPEPEAKQITGSHRVNRGESLFDIAKQYRVPMGDLVAFNKITDPSLIIPGTLLRIPGKEEIRNLHSSEPVVVAENVDKFSEDPIISQLGSWDIPEYSLVSVLEKGPAREELVSLSQETYMPIPDDVTKTYNLKVVPMSEKVIRITVEIDETLGHFADWAKTTLVEIRQLNEMGMRQGLNLGQVLDIPITTEKIANFNSKRIEYHTSIEEDFFENYKVVGLAEHTVRKNESLQQILNEYQIPLWLFRKYQTDSSSKIFKGQILKIPQVE